MAFQRRLKTRINELERRIVENRRKTFWAGETELGRLRSRGRLLERKLKAAEYRLISAVIRFGVKHVET